MMGAKVSPILFKNTRMEGDKISDVNGLKHHGYEVYVPVQFEP
jgi:hypothetical protein